ncbi:hypothetical protein [Rouxiella badensis]|uniref:hypothetical protein n=1 Tax=Rouxiella badensis TaxID=1646377 RepID=UPI003C38B77E
MSKYFTMHPIGSGAAKDFFDNAQNFDYWANSTELSYYLDRLGTQRMTLNGFNIKMSAQLVAAANKLNAQLAQQAAVFTSAQNARTAAFNGSLAEQKQRIDYVVANLGLEVIGDYEKGPYTITEYNQLIRYDNAYWKLRADVPLGTSTTGTTAASWVNDGPHFVNVGDSELRQNIADNTTAATGAGAVGYAPGNAYPYGTVGDRLNRHIDIRDYKDAHAEGGDWSYAVEAAIAAAITKGVHKVVGFGAFYTARTITIDGIVRNFDLYIETMGITSTFPNTCTSLFGTATPIFHLGSTTNINALNMHVGMLDGAYQSTVAGVASFDTLNGRTPVADGFVMYGGGMSSSHVRTGYLQNCNIGIYAGVNTAPNGTTVWDIDYMQFNRLGSYINTGTGGNQPISEANVFNLRFSAQNRIGAIWGKAGGQFTTLQNGNFDFNGRYVARLRCSDVTGLSSIAGKLGLKLTNGTTEYEFMYRYQYQGYWYVFVFSFDTDLSYQTGGNKFAWKTSDTISCPTVDGVALKFDVINVAEDDAATNHLNYFDVHHDYEDAIFAKWKIFVEYGSGIYGGKLESSYVSFDTAINPYSHQWYGFGVISNAGILSLYHYKNNNTPWLNVDGSYIYVGNGMQLNIGLTPIQGAGNVVPLPRSSGVTDWKTAWTFTDVSTYKKYAEGTKYNVQILTEYAAACAEFDLVVKGGSAAAFVKLDKHLVAFQINEVFADDGTTVTGFVLRLRQEAQDTMNATLNIVRRM